MNGQGSLVLGTADRPLDEVTRSWASRHHAIAEQCVCGVDIRAASGSAEDVLAAVQRHQIEPVHLAWDRDHDIPWSAAQRQAAAIDAIEAPTVGPYAGVR